MLHGAPTTVSIIIVKLNPLEKYVYNLCFLVLFTAMTGGHECGMLHCWEVLPCCHIPFNGQRSLVSGWVLELV